MTVEEFLKQNGINPEVFREKYGDVLITEYDSFDSNISRFAIYDDYKKEEVNIKDVVGLSRYLIEEKSVLDNFSCYFNQTGDLYHSRCNGMLDYKPQEVIERLGDSFKSEPIKLYRIKDKCFISTNGCHRFLLLRMHYLMSLARGEDESKRFMVPVEVKDLDCVKTFANYIGSLLWDEKYEVNNEFDERYNKTGNSVVTYKGSRIVMNDQEFISFVQERLNSLKELDEFYYIDAISDMWNKCKWENTGLFRSFIEEYIPELTYIMDIPEYAMLESEIRSNLIEGVNYGNS